MKKMLGVFLALLIALTSVVPVFAVEIYPPDHYKMGDITGDGKIDAKDALEALICTVYKLPWGSYYYQVAKVVLDVDGDAAITAVDALHILQYCVGKRDSFENNDLSKLQELTYPNDVTPTDISF